MKPDLTKYTFQLPTAPCWSHTWRKPSFEYLNSNHYDGSIFFNPGAQDQLQQRMLLKWLFKSKAQPWANGLATAQHTSNRLVPRERPEVLLDDWKVWFIGHATFLIQIGPYNFLTDPMWAEYAGPHQGRGTRRFCPAGIALEELPPIDAVLLSHNHYDHMDLASLNWLNERFAMPIFTGLGNAWYLPKHFNVIELDWWQWEGLGEFKIVYLPAQHSSGRGLRDHNRALWGGFAIKHQQDYCFFAGDTGYSPHFKAIYQRLGAPRVALLPIGGYAPRELMRDLHLSPEDAYQAHQDLHSRCSIAMRYRSFQITEEAREQPEQELQRVMRHTSKLINPFYCLHEGKKMIV